jgi:hypothetical protein
VVGIDILPEQGDLARSAAHESASLIQHLRHRTRVFGASGIRDDAKAAKFIAAFLHGEKSGDTG